MFQGEAINEEEVENIFLHTYLLAYIYGPDKMRPTAQ